MSTIGQTIYNSPILGEANKFATIPVIDDFFAPLSKEQAENWIYDFSSLGYKTHYASAKIGYQAGLPHSMKIECNLSNGSSSYFAGTSFVFEDDALILRIEELKRLSGRGGEDFSAKFFQKHCEFLESYESTRDKKSRNLNPSRITITASSGSSQKNGRMNGGYTWANCGFSFVDDDEKLNMQRQFKEYLSEFGIKISDTDLKLFTHPCHYAAFDCGIRFDQGLGRKENLGKNFLSYQTWAGKWQVGNPNAKEKIYARRYNSEPVKALRRRRALPCLGPQYYKMMNKFFSVYGDKKTKHGFDVYKRYAAIKKTALAR